VIRIAQIIESLFLYIQGGRRGGGGIERRREIYSESTRGGSVLIGIVIVRGLDTEASGSQRRMPKAKGEATSNDLLEWVLLLLLLLSPKIYL